jgi:hypothetical protein
LEELVDNRTVTAEEQADLVSDLLAPLPRTAIVPAVRAALGLSHKLSDRVVQAFYGMDGQGRDELVDATHAVGADRLGALGGAAGRIW